MAISLPSSISDSGRYIFSMYLRVSTKTMEQKKKMPVTANAKSVPS